MQTLLQGSVVPGRAIAAAGWSAGPEAVPSGGGGGSALFQSHIRTGQGQAVISNALGGGVVRVRIPAEGKRKGGGKRGQVSGYSRASRLRLLERLHQVDQVALPGGSVRMLTLTWPGKFPGPREAKVCLKEFLRRFRRAWGPVAVVWKLEPQERGAPHFHLLPFMGVSSSGEDDRYQRELTWCAQTWFCLAGGGDPNHLRFHLGQLGNGNRPCLEVVRTWDQVLRYVGKYVGKPVDVDWEDEWLSGVWAWPGRFWGIQCGSALPVRVVAAEVPLRVAYQVKRVLRRYIEHQATGRVGVVGRMFCDRRRMKLAEAAVLRSAWLAMGAGDQVQVKMYRRHVRRGREDGKRGMMCFLPDAEVRRVVRWAYAIVLQNTVP